ncbi:MAG: TIGR03936 family radical SAM-associated protein [Anaerolineae bacterium]|nr:TIGR03936 family radical SAM-associated protein [Anaerolineae bacterium]
MQEQQDLWRVRLTFAKGEALKYISHLDLARAWERLFRRAGLPVAYSQGFNPRPRFQIASGLPVGVTGQAELLDVWLAERLAPEEVLARLGPASPPGLEILAAEEVELRAPALQARMQAADYLAVLDTAEPAEAIRTRVEALLAAPSLPRQRHHKGKQQSYDLRPLVQSLAVRPAPSGGGILLEMRLQASPEGAGRPDQVLDVLGLTLVARSIERTKLHFDFDK